MIEMTAARYWTYWFGAFLLAVTALLMLPQSDARAQSLEEICAEYPDLAGCQPDANVPACVRYPDWAGCQPDANIPACDRYPEWAGCRDVTFCDTHSDWLSCGGEGASSSLVETYNEIGERDDLVGETHSARENNEWGLDLNGSWGGLLSDEELDALLADLSEDEIPDPEDIAENPEIDASPEEIRQRHCADVGRFSALRERLEFQKAQYNQANARRIRELQALRLSRGSRALRLESDLADVRANRSLRESEKEQRLVFMELQLQSLRAAAQRHFDAYKAVMAPLDELRREQRIAAANIRRAQARCEAR
jgi:hypothetical protein